MITKTLEMTFVPVAISIICGVLITVNQAVPVLPNWPIWRVLVISTIVACCVIGAVLVAGFVQWLLQRLEQHVNKPAV